MSATAGANSLPYQYEEEATALPYNSYDAAPDEYTFFEYNKSPRYIVGMFLAAALGAIFVLLSVAYGIRRLRRHINNDESTEPTDDKTEQGLTIEKWTKDASQKDKASNSSCTICAICSQHFVEGEEVCKSPNKFCSHVHHLSCMTNWLHLQNTCPTCNKTYLVEIV